MSYVELHASSVRYKQKPDTTHSTSSGQAPPPVPPRAIERNRPYLHASAKLDRLKRSSLQSALETPIHAFGRQNVFVEIQRHFVRGEEQINRQLVDLARANRLSIIARNGVQ